MDIDLDWDINMIPGAIGDAILDSPVSAVNQLVGFELATAVLMYT